MDDELIIEGGKDEGLGRRLTRAIRDAIFGSKDTNLPDEGDPDDPKRKAAYEREVAEDRTNKRLKTIRTLQEFGRGMDAGGSAERVKSLKRQGLSEEQATRKAIGR